MKIIVTGGGTGGHIYPALAIASELKRRIPAVEILYIGTQQGMESKIVPPSGIEFKTIDITGINRSSILKAGRSILKLPFSFFQARDIIREFKPDIVVGTGGYVSYPVVLAGSFMNARTVIHEQNAILGLANRNLARRVDLILLTFAEAGQSLEGHNVKVTGMPIRPEILNLQRQKASRDKFTLLAFGGSLGAERINQAMLDIIQRYSNIDMNFIWITGHAGYDNIKHALNNRIDTKSWLGSLNMIPYMYNIEEAFGKADLVLCRAGAGTVCELQLLGLPAIFVPYPYAAGNHQEKNARAMVERGAAMMVMDKDLDGNILYKTLEELRNDRSKLHTMGQNMLKEARPNALTDIVDAILEPNDGNHES